MNTIKAEVFAVGRWNGYEFGLSDLQQIAANFKKFVEVLKVPVKLGHNSEQPMTDGMPALGWVDDVWVEGSKLMAKLTDVPNVVMDAVRKKLYRKVSIELDVDVEYKGERYPFVLSAVALLGADIPAVSVLADLDAFLASRRAAFSARERACFEAIAGNLNTKEYDMDLKELSEKVVALSGQVATLTAQVSTLTAENTTLKTEKASYEADRASREKTEKAARVATKRTEITAIFDAGIKAGSITPAQKEVYAKTMQLDNDDAIDKMNVEDVRTICNVSKATFSKEQANGSGGGKPDDRSPDVILTERANALVAQGKATTFAAASNLVLAADADLAKRYVTGNINAQ